MDHLEVGMRMLNTQGDQPQMEELGQQMSCLRIRSRQSSLARPHGAGSTKKRRNTEPSLAEKTISGRLQRYQEEQQTRRHDPTTLNGPLCPFEVDTSLPHQFNSLRLLLDTFRRPPVLFLDPHPPPIRTNLDSLAQLIDYKPPARLKLKRKDNSPASNNLLEWEKSRELPLEVPCNSPLDDRSLFG